MYSAVVQRNFPNQETWFLQATLLEDGVPFAYVSNAGTGGSHVYHPVTEDYAAFNEAIDRFNAVAEALPREFDFEKDDQLVEDLVNEWFATHNTIQDALSVGLTIKDLHEMEMI